MNRGDVYWVDIPQRTPEGREIAKSRPCVVISLPAANKVRTTVVVVPLTSNNKTYPPIAIAIPSQGADSVAICDQLFAVDKKRLRKQAGTLTKQELSLLDDSLRQVLGL